MSVVVRKDPLVLVRSSAEAAKTSGTIKLSSFDKGYVHFRFTSLLVFDQPTHEAAKTIKMALSKTLVHYYLLSGRITNSGVDNDDELYIRCTNEGVEFVAASANCALKKVKSFDRTLLGKLIVDFPHRGHHATDPLLSLQVTDFTCGGFILAVTWNHATADGVGIAQFLGAVGELTRGFPSPSTAPVRWDGSVSSCPPPFNAVQQAMIMSPEPVALASLDIVIPLSSINRVRDKFCSRFSGQQCTMVEVVTAILWQCRTRAIASNNPETPVFISFVANVRKHVGASDGYYGNCLTHQVVKATSSTVANTDVVNLVTIIKHAKNKIPDQFKKNASSNNINQLEGLEGRYNMLHVSSWRNLGFDKVDFGSGGAARVIFHGPGTPVPVCVVFLPCKGEDGATVLSVSVKEEHAAAFLGELARFL